MSNKLEQSQTLSNRQSGKRVASSRGKTDLRYWRKSVFRARSGSGGLVPDYSCRIAYKGRRTTFPLGTPNQEAAAEKARSIYTYLIANGWDSALEKFKPSSLKEAKEASKGTVGEFLHLVKQLADIAPGTFAGYARSFRRIVADLEGIPAASSRFDASHGGNEKWRGRIDGVKLASIAPDCIQSWRLRYIEKAGVEPDAITTAKVSANSIMRQAKSLFSKRVLAFVSERFTLPSTLPFDGVEFFGKLRSHFRYRSQINARELLSDAIAEVAPINAEAFKILILALCCGLRRNEIDKLTWPQVDFDAGLIRVHTTRFFKAKSEDSAADVDLDPEVVALLRGWKAASTGQFVVESEVVPRMGATYAHYRADAHFEALRGWLREKGVTSQKFLHELRKEYGSLVAEKHGLYAASRALRHSDVQVTAMHYLDKKQRISVGLGEVLASAPPANVISIEGQQNKTLKVEQHVGSDSKESKRQRRQG